MRKYELSIATNYVADWGHVEAVREIFQNALDAGDYTWGYDASEDTLYITNVGAQLEPSTLLLGCSSKRDDASTIGQFGEGYKIALLVLTRLGKMVTIYNGLSREIWTTRLVNSRRYNAQVLTVFVDKLSIWEKPEDQVTFEIRGITAAEYEDIKESNLHIECNGETIPTDKGEILCDKAYQGKIYVNGLYVSTDSKLHYGYNFKPESIKLDRDRKTVSTWDLVWNTSFMWMQVGGDRCVDLCFEGAHDVSYISYSSDPHSVKFHIKERFESKYGANAIPCTDQDDADHVAQIYRGVKPVIVSACVYDAIAKECRSKFTPVEDQRTLRERLEEWYKKYVEDDISSEGEKIWEELLEEID